jgi:hypothetical protein
MYYSEPEAEGSSLATISSSNANQMKMDYQSFAATAKGRYFISIQNTIFGHREQIKVKI